MLAGSSSSFVSALPFFSLSEFISDFQLRECLGRPPLALPFQPVDFLAGCSRIDRLDCECNRDDGIFAFEGFSQKVCSELENRVGQWEDRKSTRLNSSHSQI